MWTAIILILLLFISSALFMSERYWKAQLIGFILLLVSIGGIITSLVVSCNVPVHNYVEERRTDIVALSDNTRIQGSYFLVFGSIDQNPVYYYYERTDNGGFKQNSISANDVIIYQDTDSTGYILRKSFYHVINADYAKQFNGWVWYSKEYPIYDYVIEIHVPPDTIIQQFKLDLN